MEYQFGKSSVISRTFYVCKAEGLYFDGFENGRPQMVVVESESYVTTNPNDMSAAKRMVKKANKDVILNTITVETIATEVVAMDIASFIANGEVVERSANGRVK